MLSFISRYFAGYLSHCRSPYRNRCLHRKRADALVAGDAQLFVTDTIPDVRSTHLQFVFDVKLTAPVNISSQWHLRTGPEHALSQSGFLLTAETSKYSKHEDPYARMGLGFLAFVISTFGVMSPTLIRYLTLLADHKVAVSDQHRALQHLDALTTSAARKLRARYLSELFAQVSAAAVNATVMRLLGTAFLPHAPPVHRLPPRPAAPPDPAVLRHSGPPPTSRLSSSS